MSISPVAAEEEVAGRVRGRDCRLAFSKQRLVLGSSRNWGFSCSITIQLGFVRKTRHTQLHSEEARYILLLVVLAFSA